MFYPPPPPPPPPPPNNDTLSKGSDARGEGRGGKWLAGDGGGPLRRYWLPCKLQLLKRVTGLVVSGRFVITSYGLRKGGHMIGME